MPLTVKLLCGDALKELPKLKACSVQCVVTSPPFTFGISSRRKIWKELNRVLTLDGTVFWDTNKVDEEIPLLTAWFINGEIIRGDGKGKVSKPKN